MARGPAVQPRSLNTAMAVLFMIGSACFALGTVPAYVAAVGAATDAGTFFLGSVFFTSASFCQLLQAQSPGMAPDAAAAGRVRVRFWAPKPADRGWLSAAVQFPGTIAFNVSTAFALATSLTVQQTDRLVWAPDFVGSILFLVASWFGIAAVSTRFFQWTPARPVVGHSVDQHARIRLLHVLGHRGARSADDGRDGQRALGERRDVRRRCLLLHRRGAAASGVAQDRASEARAEFGAELAAQNTRAKSSLMLTTVQPPAFAAACTFSAFSS